MFDFPRDEKAVSRAIELNEQLQKVLARHDALLSCKPTSTVNHLNQDQAEEEEEAEQLFRRYVHYTGLSFSWKFKYTYSPLSTFDIPCVHAFNSIITASFAL